MKQVAFSTFILLAMCCSFLLSCESSVSLNENKKEHISYFGDSPPNPAGTEPVAEYSSDLERTFALQLMGNWKLKSANPKLDKDLDDLGYHFMEGKQFYRSLGFFKTPIINWNLTDDSVVIGGNSSLKIKALKILDIDSNEFTAVLVHDSVTATFIREKEK